MAGVPINFAVPSEASLVSYNFTDIAEGSGVVVFYAGRTATSAATTNRLNNQVFNPAQASWTYGNPPTPNGKVYEVDFDTPIFNIQKVVKGRMLANVRTFLAQANGYYVMRVYKVTGVTETELVNVQSETLNGVRDMFWHSFEAVIPQTIIPAGSFIRITLEAWAVRTSSTTYMATLYNPTGIDVTAPFTIGGDVVTWTDTDTKFFIPFRIDN